MKNTVDIDLRDLKPSAARRLGVALEDSAFQSAFIGKLSEYLSELKIEQPAAADQAVGLSHELASVGAWERLNWQALAEGLASVPARKLKMFFSVAPHELEEKVIEAASGKPKEKRPAATKKLGLREMVVGKARYNVRIRSSFPVYFESQQVEESLNSFQTRLTKKEHQALSKILDEASRVYVKGMGWVATVEKLLSGEFRVVGKITSGVECPPIFISGKRSSGLVEGYSISKRAASAFTPLTQRSFKARGKKKPLLVEVTGKFRK